MTVEKNRNFFQNYSKFKICFAREKAGKRVPDQSLNFKYFGKKII